MKIMAIDYGDAHTGVAISDRTLTLTGFSTVITAYRPEAVIEKLLPLISEHEVTELVLGHPLNMDGTQGFQTQKVREFAEKLTEAGLAVEFYDERMTTVLAEGALLEADMRRENRKKKVDMVAAVMILQSYLDAQAARAAASDQAGEEAEPEDDGILEMEDEDGQIIRFRLSATIAYAGETYVLLSCEEAAGGFEQGESLIMLSTTDDEGESCYQSLEDDALIEAVYDAYLKQTGGA